MASRRNGSLVLIVDPDEADRELAVRALRRVGFTILTAASGEEALELAQRRHPRVVLLEVCLPGICGYEVCRELRDEYGESLSIMFVSGARTEPFDRIGGLLLGANDYLVKPFVGDELLARVRALLRRETEPTAGVASTLTQREQEVLGLLVQGLAQKEIASRLAISQRTVSTHVEHIFAKLGVRNRAQAVALAYQEDLLVKYDSIPLIPLSLPSVDFWSDWLSALGSLLPG
jgi:DNA-binding NarL/FixJ family response regulator